MKKIITFIGGVYLLGFLFLMSTVGPKPAFAGSAPNVSSLYNLTVSSLVATGPGTLFNISIATGAVGDQAVCFDSASASGFQTSAPSSTYTVTELLRVTVQTSTWTPSVPYAPGVPANFNNGLVCIQSAADRTLINWRQPS